MIRFVWVVKSSRAERYENQKLISSEEYALKRAPPREEVEAAILADPNSRAARELEHQRGRQRAADYRKRKEILKERSRSRSRGVEG